MKPIPILLVAILLSASAHAQAPPDNRWQIQINGLYALPTGEFSHKHSNSEYLGQAQYGLGGTLTISRPIYKGFGLGLSIGSVIYKIHKDHVRESIQTTYNRDNDYFVTTTFKNSFQVSQVALELFKEVPIKSIRLRPFVRLGLGGMSNVGDVDIRLKKRNDNYFETLKIAYATDSGADTDNEFNFFYPSLGADLSFPLSNYLYCQAGAVYSPAKADVRRTVYTTNVFNESGSTSRTMTQTLSSLQLFAGISVKFGKRR